MMRNKNQKGFTLIELLVVIAIIGLLAGGVMLALASARVRSRDTKRIADIKEIATAMESYFVQCNSYPVVLTPTLLDSTKSLASGTQPLCGDNGGGGTNGGVGSNVGDVLFLQFSTAPLPSDASCPTADGGSDANPYMYSSYLDTEMVTASVAGDVRAGSYRLRFCLGTATGSYAAGIHTLTPSGVQ